MNIYQEVVLRFRENQSRIRALLIKAARHIKAGEDAEALAALLEVFKLILKNGDAMEEMGVMFIIMAHELSDSAYGVHRWIKENEALYDAFEADMLDEKARRDDEDGIPY